MSNVPKEILERLKNIQVRTDISRGVTKEEAATAAALLTRELAKHNLSILDLDYFAQDTVTHEVLATHTQEWQRSLMLILGKHNGCQVLYFEGEGEIENHSLFVVGEPQNIALVGELYKWLSDEFPKMAQKALEEARNWTETIDENTDTFVNYLKSRRKMYEMEASRDLAWFDPGQWLSSYLYGLTLGLDEKMKLERENATEKENALVPLMSEKARRYIEETFPFEEVDIREEVTPSMLEGMRKGKEVSLTTQVYGAESTLELEG